MIRKGLIWNRICYSHDCYSLSQCRSQPPSFFSFSSSFFFLFSLSRQSFPFHEWPIGVGRESRTGYSFVRECILLDECRASPGEMSRADFLVLLPEMRPFDERSGIARGLLSRRKREKEYRTRRIWKRKKEKKQPRVGIREKEKKGTRKVCRKTSITMCTHESFLREPLRNFLRYLLRRFRVEGSSSGRCVSFYLGVDILYDILGITTGYSSQKYWESGFDEVLDRTLR